MSELFAEGLARRGGRWPICVMWVLRPAVVGLLIGNLAIAVARAQIFPVAPPTAPPVVQAMDPVASVSRGGAKGVAGLPSPPGMVPLGGATVTVWRERAEDASQVTAALGSERALVQGAVVAEGSGAFQLANPDWLNESVVLDRTIFAAGSTKLFFESKLGWADSNQVAKLQVSTNGGGSWTTLWSRAGTGGAGQGGFELVAVPLAPYAGMSVDIRFFYGLTDPWGFAYTGTSSSEGWFIDDIQIGESFVKRPYEGTGDPTGDEIQMLEFINRARADAVAEATRLRATTDTNVLSAINYFGVNLTLMQEQFAALTRTAQPLAMNAKLLAAARLHSQDMLDNVFQGHTSSSSPPSPNLPGDALTNRVLRQNYTYSSLAENVYSYAKGTWHCHAGFNIDWGSGPGGMQTPAGHRGNIHNPALREIGIGAVWGSKTAGSTTVGPLLVTHDIGVGSGGGQPLITGVTYADADGDNFYDPGEGVGGVRVDVEGASYYAVSSTHGAYAVPVSTNGVYQVTFQRQGYAPLQGAVTVAGGLNAKADYRGQSLRLDSVGSISSNSVRLVAAAGQTVSSFAVRATTNFLSWTNVSHARTDLPGGQVQIDATLPGATNRAFFQVEAIWAAP